ncbi:MAG: hypothetical protein P8130_02350 [Deltaproteobacteria bacterium]
MEQMSGECADRYIGRILQGDYSDRLKKRVEQRLVLFASLERILPRVMPYISAWQEDEPTIWYEYADQRLADFFACPLEDVATFFQRYLIDRRSYKYVPMEEVIREEVIPSSQLSGYRHGLREEVILSGMVEAVYKLAMPDESVFWLKDWAVTEYFAEDGLYLSCGSLTDVAKEMDHKEVLEQIGYFDELTKLPKRNIMHRILEINIGQMQRGHLGNFVFLRRGGILWYLPR